MVSGDEAGSICMWNMQNGNREGYFKNAHGSAKITAMAFDAAERRLLTASNDGSVKMWNFNNGSLLREFVHQSTPMEISCIIFVHDDARELNQVSQEPCRNCRRNQKIESSIS